MEKTEGIWLDEEEVKDILRDKNKKLKQLEQRKKIYYNELKKGMEAYAIPSSPVSDGIPRRIGWHSDLGDLLDRASHVQDNAVHELCAAVEEIREKEKLIDRVWLCFAALPDPYFGILQSLYVEGELYDAAIAEQKLSRSTFERKRKQGIRQLIVYCESDLTSAELLHYGQINARLAAEKKKRKPKTGQEASLRRTLEAEHVAGPQKIGRQVEAKSGQRTTGQQAEVESGRQKADPQGTGWEEAGQEAYRQMSLDDQNAAGGTIGKKC